MKKHRPFWALWGGPIVTGVLTTTGLLTALVSDTWGDWWSWVALGIPVGVMWAGTAGRAHQGRRPQRRASAQAWSGEQFLAAGITTA